MSIPISQYNLKNNSNILRLIYKTTTNSNRYEKFELFKWLGLTCLNSINIHHWIDSVHLWIE